MPNGAGVTGLEDFTETRFLAADAAGTEDRLYGPLGEIVRETRAIPIQGGQVHTYVTQYQFDTWNACSAWSIRTSRLEKS